MSLDTFRAFEICRVDIRFGGHGHTARRTKILTLMKKPLSAAQMQHQKLKKEASPKQIVWL